MLEKQFCCQGIRKDLLHNCLKFERRSNLYFFFCFLFIVGKQWLVCTFINISWVGIIMAEVKVDKELVKKVAQNARLSLTDEELERFTSEIREIIVKSFNQLDEIDVSNEEASFQPIKQQNVFRKDIAEKPLSQESALLNVKEELKEKGYMKGPKVL
jgi:aspartyl-tRNA(Asn)/glutamyl-tRNA(Gln) amidotransferase subunit C